MSEPAPAVELKAAGVRIGARTLWLGVGLTVRPGELAAIVGPNGAGKSTLLSVLLGFTALAEGSVTVLGGTPAQARPRVGYLPQRRSFDVTQRLRGVDVVRLGVDGVRWGVPLPGRRARQVRERVAEVVEQVGATAYARRPIGSLSGGEQQRLLLAQALAHRPALLLLDEPLDSLDTAAQDSFAEVLARVCRDEGTAALVVTHDRRPLEIWLQQVLDLGVHHAVTG